MLQCSVGHAMQAEHKFCQECGAPPQFASKQSRKAGQFVAGFLVALLGGGGAFWYTQRSEAISLPWHTVASSAATENDSAILPDTRSTMEVGPVLNSLDGSLTDQTGLLTERRADVLAALDRVADETPFRLFVFYVDSFEGMDEVEWANKKAQANNLGQNDVVLAVAIDGGFAISYDNKSGLTSADTLAMQNAAKGALDTAANAAPGEADWAAAPIATADILLDRADTVVNR